MLSAKAISKQFNDQIVLDGVDLNLSGVDRIGLIGANGSGKTTLLRILVGDLKADNGSIDSSHAKIGYLPQELSFDQTVADYLRANAGKALKQVSLERVSLKQTIQQLSGGQKTRAGLAKLMLGEPNVLLLDEPTNNLDLEGLTWLEKFIENFKGAVLFTSHDRAFLNRVATSIAELKDGKLRLFGGNYDFYKQQLQREAEAQLEDFKSQEKYRKRLEADIKRTKQQALGQEKGTTNYYFRKIAKGVAKKAKARERRLEKQMAATDWVKKPEAQKDYRHQFAGAVHQSKLVLQCRGLTKAFTGRSILGQFDLEISGPAHVWLKGRNGSGKSTLLKMVAGQLKPDAGIIQIGEDVRVGYFTQETSQLDLKQSAISQLMELGLTKTEVMREANRLRIEPVLMNKTLSQLSRGQLTKIEFMKLLLGDNQLLLLDEPTNHLEIDTREAIEEALKNYQGAILVASHDRYFLDAIGINQSISLDTAQ